MRGKGRGLEKDQENGPEIGKRPRERAWRTITQKSHKKKEGILAQGGSYQRNECRCSSPKKGKI